MTSLHGVTELVALCLFLGSYTDGRAALEGRNAPGPAVLGTQGSGAHLRGEGRGQCWNRVGKQGRANLPQLSSRARLGRAWAERPAKPSLGCARLPNCLSWRLLFLQIRRSGGFADPLRLPGHVHWLAGWLTRYLNWKHEGIPLKWSSLVGLTDTLESSFGRCLLPTFVDNHSRVWSGSLFSCVCVTFSTDDSVQVFLNLIWDGRNTDLMIRDHCLPLKSVPGRPSLYADFLPLRYKIFLAHRSWPCYLPLGRTLDVTGPRFLICKMGIPVFIWWEPAGNYMR